MKKMVGSNPLECSLAMIASFVAYMQHTDEHQLLPHEVSREPTHWMKAIFFGSLPSEIRWTWPKKGPEAERIRSNWIAVTTFG